MCNKRKEKKLFGIRTKLLYNKIFHRKYISNRNEKKKKNQILMDDLGLSILDISKTVMYEFW